MQKVLEVFVDLYITFDFTKETLSYFLGMYNEKTVISF